MTNLIGRIIHISPRLPDLLLADNTTGRNILFATNSYEHLGEHYLAEREITPELITGSNAGIIKPRCLKAKDEQKTRTKKKAEVFTPSWICNLMNNQCDEAWFGAPHIFNVSISEKTWEPTTTPIPFTNGKAWKDYVDSLRLEITCGEAPFLVSRVDTTTGDPIPISHRIGMLDRKLRVVNENAADEAEWIEWAIRAIQSVYGYEYQGDNLVIARINILMTFVEYLQDRWSREPTISEIEEVANIIAWNLWQMDGLKDVPPFNLRACLIFNWRANKSITFESLKKGA